MSILWADLCISPGMVGAMPLRIFASLSSLSCACNTCSFPTSKPRRPVKHNFWSTILGSGWCGAESDCVLVRKLMRGLSEVWVRVVVRDVQLLTVDG